MYVPQNHVLTFFFVMQTVAAELSKKKMDDPLLMTLHNIAFGKAAKRVHVKTNLRQFRGVQYDEQLDRAKLEQRVSSRSHLILQKLCGILHISAGGSSADLTGRIVDFLECPMDTKPAKKGEGKSAATKNESSDEEKATPKASPKKASPKKASPKKASPKKATPKKTEAAAAEPAAKKAKTEKAPAKKAAKKEKIADETAKASTTKKSASKKGCEKSCKK